MVNLNSETAKAKASNTSPTSIRPAVLRALRALVDELNCIIHRENLYVSGFSSGHMWAGQKRRVINAHLRGDMICVEDLYTEMSQPIESLILTNGYGSNVPNPMEVA